MIEPKNDKEALLDEFWVKAMQEESEQFIRKDVWTLVPRPEHINVICTKWIFKNKTNEFCNIVRNTGRLVAKRYTRIEGIDFNKTFVPIARRESFVYFLL